jgi:hypothetical protein
MHPDTFSRLQQLWARCTEDESYMVTFYDILLQRSPHFRHLFAQVDMEQQRQRLRQRLPMLLELPDLPPDSERLAWARQQHAQRHHLGDGEGSASDQNYALWTDTLCQTFRRCDPSFDDELEAALRQRLGQAIALLREVPAVSR